MDYRFRVEQDWNSVKSDGAFRDDRTRMRYRFRTGITYEDEQYSFGFRIRTGDPNKQQDPQLTLGKGFREFGTIPIGFEKIYFQYRKNQLKFWVGKNSYPFKKSNELFWSDNVFPEGVTLDKTFNVKNGPLKKVNLVLGHYLIGSNNKSILNDAYFQGIQSNFQSRNDHLEISTALYLFKNVPNIPDGGHTFELPYSILHLRGGYALRNIFFDVDFYYNLSDYSQFNEIPDQLYDQKNGFTIGLQYGTLKESKNWMFKCTYAYLEKYSVLDYMAQNDWARWDYSAFNSPDGRLSNFRGIEAVVAYAINEKINIVSKYYIVEQLIPVGLVKENGQRIRFDINVKI